jgi:phospholipid/cholesterol/gamma-HCH transport system permease protein
LSPSELTARLQDFYVLSAAALWNAFKRPFYAKEIAEQMDYAGSGSFFIVSTVSLFVGMVLSLQISANLAPLGLKMYTGNAVGLSVIREIGPVVVGLAFAGRVASGMTSEIGSMVLGHQVDVLRVHGISPLKRLVTPRVMSTTLMLPVLTIIGDGISLIGGYMMILFQGAQEGTWYWMQITKALGLESFALGLIKPVVFGYLIGCISCYLGLSTTGGAKGLRRSTTAAVVYSTLMVIFSDFLLTKMLLYVIRGGM